MIQIKTRQQEDDSADETKSLKESTPTDVSNAPTLEDIVNSENSNEFWIQLTTLLSHGKNSST